MRMARKNSEAPDSSLEAAEPDPADVAGFDAFMQRIRRRAAVERAAVEHSDKLELQVGSSDRARRIGCGGDRRGDCSSATHCAGQC